MSHPTLLVLAAGMGTRYGGGGLSPLETVGPGGETIADYSIYDAHRAGFGKVIFVIRRSVEARAREVVAARFGARIPYDFVHQETLDLPPGFQAPAGRVKPWGTAHAVLMAMNAIHEPFAVINANDFYGEHSYHALARYLQSGIANHAIVSFILRNTLSDFGSVARHICEVNDRGYLDRIVEHKAIEREKGHAVSIAPDGAETPLTGDEAVSMNMWGFTPAIFKPLAERFAAFLRQHGNELDSEFSLHTAVNELLASGSVKVRVLHSVDSWFGLTYHEDHERAVENIRHLNEDGHYPHRLWAA
ncbi:MAG TPA: hypothetical protein VKB38_19770 [Terracidiphilus sp.]|nr:hypothetical protein [Terracidiphilus sp.]